jgi:hypothetical protein
MQLTVPSMTRKIKLYKPIHFGDGPDPGTVEGHRNRVAEAAGTRAYNRRMKELEAQDAAKRGGLPTFGFAEWISSVVSGKGRSR